jgi:hypothetical protein
VEHVVFYTAADGSPAYRRTANLDDAVRVVEHLRNAEGREEVHVYSLNSVALNFRPYYRVELNTNPPIAAQPDAGAAPAPATQLHALPSELAAFAAESVEAEAEAAAPAQAEQPQAELSRYAEPVAQAEVAAEPTPEPARAVAPPAPEVAEAEVEAAAPAPPAPPAPPAAEPMGAFMPMPPIAVPMPPAAEPVPAMAAAGQPEADEATDQNGQARGRGLGFFTR